MFDNLKTIKLLLKYLLIFLGIMVLLYILLYIYTEKVKIIKEDNELYKLFIKNTYSTTNNTSNCYNNVCFIIYS